MQGSDKEPHVARLLPEDDHLGGKGAIPKSLEGEIFVEGALMPTFLSFPDREGSIQLHISAPVCWCLPSGPGIVTLRDQPVVDEQKHFRQGLADKNHFHVPRAGRS